MRLLSLEVNGVRRLLKTKCHLGGKLTAVVGPNEAGKTTLLYALRHITNNEQIIRSDLFRSDPPGPDDVVIAADWELEEDDLQALNPWALSASPTRLRIEKKPNGRRSISVTPKPERDSRPYLQALAPLKRYLGGRAGKGLPRKDPEDATSVLELGDHLEWLVAELEADRWRSWDADDAGRLTAMAEDIAKRDSTPGTRLGNLTRSLQQLAAASARSNPDEVWRFLLGRVPACLEFQQADRDLAASYDLAQIDAADPPTALANLASLAGLNLQLLVDMVDDGDRGMAATALRQANVRLENFYNKSWRQSDLRVVIDRDGSRLDILVEEADGSTYVLHERSEGLRSFVALTAFLARHDVENPILLIDEAETHLHYDAQRDFVDVLLEQEIAKQVIYTTHSPGCLPPDLGTSIRAVVPSDQRVGSSRVSNEFWSSNAPGFSPLLLMMGAAAAAFTTTRAALMVEGPSDMILMPSLVRKATGLPSLPYHVAPGLSATAPERYKDFDFVASRLVYVVDGDAGGQALRDSLIRNGVDASRVLALGGFGSGVTLEDLVSKESFVRALNSELGVTNQQLIQSLPDGLGRYKIAEKVCGEAGVRTPSKVAVAGRILWQSGGIELEAMGRRVLLQVHQKSLKLLAA